MNDEKNPPTVPAPENTNEVKKAPPVKIPVFDKNIFAEKEVVATPAPAPKVEIKPQTPVDYIMRGAVFFFLSILLLVAVYLVFKYSQDFLGSGQNAKEQKLVFENALVRADKSRVVALEAGATKESVRNVIIQALLNEKVAEDEVSIIMPSYLRDTEIDGERKLVSELQRGDDFFFTFAVRSPLNLRTIASEKYAIGTVGVLSGQESTNKNFFVFSVASPPDATREMLTWESQIYNDMREVLQLRTIKGDFYFKDLSDNNHLLRVGYDDEGVVMVYGYGAPKTIIVAPDANTFQKVYLRLK